MALTKEQWETFDKALSGTWGSIEMLIDGYSVRFIVECCKKKGMSYTYCILVYVKSSEDDGKFMFKGKCIEIYNYD